MLFTETRGNDGIHPQSLSFSNAILSPVASFGGIYSPMEMPSLDTEFLSSQVNASYKSLALALLKAFEIDVDFDILEQAVELYDRFDNADNPVPVVKVSEKIYISELYHGPTRAFKDMALQPFGLILSKLAQNQDKQYLILAATSGDTGPAALETFRQRDNIRVACLYPSGGTSDVQRLQMVTESADNLKVIGIKGNFDDAQAALKSLLASPSFNEALKKNQISLSAANSVNFGRIIFQILYQFHAYLELVRQQAITMGDEVNLHIPSGNFGNALGAFYAKKMGLPVAKIYIASNANNVLTEWINTGKYDLSTRSLVTTNSPAMDILKSSNVERVLFDLFGSQRTRDLMLQLDQNGYYQLDKEETDQIQSIFSASCCSDEEGQQFISEYFKQGYLMDPHTATCFKSCNMLNNQRLNIVHSTAEWTKFAPTIDLAINGNHSTGDFESLKAIAERAGISIPKVVKDLFDKPVCHDDVVEKSEIEEKILAFIDQSVAS